MKNFDVSTFEEVCPLLSLSRLALAGKTPDQLLEVQFIQTIARPLVHVWAS
jgi:hypothetical protein